MIIYSSIIICNTGALKVFLHLPFSFSSNLQHTVLIINTVILITALIVVELIYSEKPRSKRKELRYFYPLFMVLIGILIFAAYKQIKVS